MSERGFRSPGLLYGLAGAAVLIVALALIGVGLVRMTAAVEPVPFRNACQGDDACRAALAERLPALQGAPGGAPSALHEALTRSAPVLAPDATLAACQATGAPESCALDPARLKPGEAGALVAVLDAHSLTLTRQARACRDIEGCAARALAALGEYGFDPLRLQGALQRTSYPLPSPLKNCADAGADTMRDACEAELLLKAAPEALTVALEQDWRSGGDQVRLPRPAPPQVEMTRNALWAGLGAALGMLVVGLAWTGAALAGPRRGKGRLTKAAQGGPVFAGASHMPALAVRPTEEIEAVPSRPAVASRASAALSGTPSRNARPAETIHPEAASPERAPAGSGSRAAPARPPARRATPEAGRPPASPPSELIVFQGALAIPGEPSTFARLAAEEGARLSPRFDDGERLAAGAILAAHRLKGDRPAEAHAAAYDDLVFGLAGDGHRLVWPRPGAPITAEMETCDDGDLYSHAVEAVVRPGLVDGAGALILRARVRAR